MDTKVLNWVQGELSELLGTEITEDYARYINFARYCFTYWLNLLRQNSAAEVLPQFRAGKQSNFCLNFHCFHQSNFYLHYNIYASSWGSFKFRVKDSLVIRDIAKNIFRRRSNFSCVSGGILRRRNTRHTHYWYTCGMWWRLGWDDDFQPEGCGSDSRSTRHVGTLGKFFTCSCLCASAWNSDTVSVL